MLRWETGNQRTLALGLAILFLGSTHSAHAAFDGSELEEMLGWLYLVPIGLFQLLMAFAVNKHVNMNLVASTLVAIVASLAAGLVATLTLGGGRGLVPVLTIVMLGPGVSICAALVRARRLPVGLALLLVPPLPFILRLWDKLL